jgi:hypothetical protein
LFFLIEPFPELTPDRTTVKAFSGRKDFLPVEPRKKSGLSEY